MSMHKVIALYTKDLPSLFHHPITGILSLSPLLEAASAQASRCYPSNLQGCPGSGSRMGYLDRNNKQTDMVDPLMTMTRRMIEESHKRNRNSQYNINNLTNNWRMGYHKITMTMISSSTPRCPTTPSRKSHSSTWLSPIVLQRVQICAANAFSTRNLSCQCIMLK